MSASTPTTEQQKESVLRQLVTVWSDFESKLNQVPIVNKLNRGKLRLEDYRLLLHDHRQQAIEGGRWISLASANIDHEHFELRSSFLRHAVTEHRDFKMLESDYVEAGGDLKTIRNGYKNIGSEALSAWVYHKASQPNPFDLLGAMFIIEGLGKNIAENWGKSIQKQLNLSDKAVSFYLYHGQHDDDHLQQLEDALLSGILNIPNMADSIVKTAKVTARLYLLQLEELGNY